MVQDREKCLRAVLKVSKVWQILSGNHNGDRNKNDSETIMMWLAEFDTGNTLHDHGVVCILARSGP